MKLDNRLKDMKVHWMTSNLEGLTITCLLQYVSQTISGGVPIGVSFSTFIPGLGSPLFVGKSGEH